jgi:hemolysin type calcium-binding protein
MSKSHGSSTYAKATITIAALAASLAIALIAASRAHAEPCTTTGTATGTEVRDRMCGSPGADTMLGLGGGDRLTGGDGNDTLRGGDGDDTIEGGNGNDVLVGDLGSDILLGEAGNDQLRLRDGQLDNFGFAFTCGNGTDSVDMDLVDAAFLTGHLVGGLLTLLVLRELADCENISVGAVNEGPNVVISRRSVAVGASSRIPVRLRCPGSLSAPCAGTLRIGSSKKGLGAPKAYSIDPGKKENVSARLSHRDRRKLRRRGQLNARVVSIEQGQLGAKTTVQTIKLNAPG